MIIIMISVKPQGKQKRLKIETKVTQQMIKIMSKRVENGMTRENVIRILIEEEKNFVSLSLLSTLLF